MNNGVQLLVHCGVNTVETNGDGFRVLNKKQGEKVKAGEPIVEVNMKKLKANYDMSTMLIITDAAGQDIQFKGPQTIKRGDSVILQLPTTKHEQKKPLFQINPERVVLF